MDLRSRLECTEGEIFLDVKVEPHWGTMPAKVWDTGVWVSDSSRIRRELGWAPTVTFEEGLRKQIEWFLDKPELRPFYEELTSRRAARRKSSV